MGNDVIHTDWERQRESLSAYLDDELSASDMAEMRAHLATCAECQRELAALRQTRALLRALPTPALPRSFTLPTEPVIIGRARREPPGWSRPLQALGGIAAMIGLGLLVSTSLPHPGATMAGSSMAPQSSHQAEYGPITNGGATATPPASSTQHGTAATPAPTATSQPVQPNHAENEQPFPLAPVSGGVLLVGGVAAITVGSLSRRRRRDSAA